MMAIATMVKINGKWDTLRGWTLFFGVVPPSTVYPRLASGWSILEAMTTPKGKKRGEILRQAPVG